MGSQEPAGGTSWREGEGHQDAGRGAQGSMCVQPDSRPLGSPESAGLPCEEENTGVERIYS